MPVSYGKSERISADYQASKRNHFSKYPYEQNRSLMFKQKSMPLAISAVALLKFCPHASIAEQFRSDQVLRWSTDSQSFYFRASVGMAGLIAARNNKAHSDCVDQWYFSNPGKADESIIETMRKSPEHHPQAVILALLQKACGTFTY